MTSLGKNCYVGTLNYKKLVPPVSTLEKAFIADTDIEEGKVVQLKTNGNIEAISGSESVAPAFPIQPYQAFAGTGSGGIKRNSVMYADLNKVIIGVTNLAGTNIRLYYADIDKTSSTPLDFAPVQSIYTASGTITFVECYLDKLYKDPSKARGISVFVETGGSAPGTWVIGWEYDYSTKVASAGTKVQIDASSTEVGAVWVDINKFFTFTTLGNLQLNLIDWTNFTITPQTPVSSVATGIQNQPRLTQYQTGGDLYVLCWFQKGFRITCVPVKVDFPTFTIGVESQGTVGGNHAVTSEMLPGNIWYILANQNSPGVGIFDWTFDIPNLTCSQTAPPSGTNVSSGGPMAIEYLPVAGVDYLVWFSEGYISNIPFAGYYNLATAANAPFTLTPSAPADWGALGVIDEDKDIVFAWTGTADGRACVCNLGDRTTNLNADRIIGVSKETKVTGQEVDIELLGSLSELTTNETFVPTKEVYVDFEGVVSQQPKIGEVSIGKAVSSNQALLHTTPVEL